MFALMLDLRYKNHRIVSIFVGKELAVGVVEDYDKKALFPLLLNTYQFLHPLTNSSSMGEKASDEEFNLTFLRCLLGQLSHSKEVVSQEVNLFRKYPDIKEIVSFRLVG